jgi:hypothetical protein
MFLRPYVTNLTYIFYSLVKNKLFYKWVMIIIMIIIMYAVFTVTKHKGNFYSSRNGTSDRIQTAPFR